MMRNSLNRAGFVDAPRRFPFVRLILGKSFFSFYVCQRLTKPPRINYKSSPWVCDVDFKMEKKMGKIKKEKELEEPHPDPFHERFISVLEMENSKFWMKELGIQLNLLWGWKKGNYPGLRYAMEICRISGVSPNWLFMGIGPRFIEDLDQVEDAVLFDESLKEEILADMMKLRRQVKFEHEQAEYKVEEILSDIETVKALKIFADVFEPGVDMKEIRKQMPAAILNKITLPFLNFLETNSTDVARRLKACFTSEKGADIFMQMVGYLVENRVTVQS